LKVEIDFRTKKSTPRYASLRGVIFKVDYLREYESIFETTLAHESVDPGALFDEKNKGRKSRATVPLKNFPERKIVFQ
jgi:hypothetical protein